MEIFNPCLILGSNLVQKQCNVICLESSKINITLDTLDMSSSWGSIWVFWLATKFSVFQEFIVFTTQKHFVPLDSMIPFLNVLSARVKGGDITLVTCLLMPTPLLLYISWAWLGVKLWMWRNNLHCFNKHQKFYNAVALLWSSKLP
jgi:hypothetical protein